MTLIGQFVTTVLQGILVTVLGWSVYKVGENGFRAFRSFQSKEMAQLLVVGFLLGTGLTGDAIFRALESATLGFSDIQKLGLVVIVSRMLVNEMVENWNHDDEKSIAVHVFGAALVAVPLL